MVLLTYIDTPTHIPTWSRINESLGNAGHPMDVLNIIGVAIGLAGGILFTIINVLR